MIIPQINPNLVDYTLSPKNPEMNIFNLQKTRISSICTCFYPENKIFLHFSPFFTLDYQLCGLL